MLSKIFFYIRPEMFRPGHSGMTEKIIRPEWHSAAFFGWLSVATKEVNIMIHGKTEGKQRRSYLSFLILCPLIFFIFSCSSIKQYVRPDIDINSIKTVAVLPFENFSSDNYADEKIRSRVIIELLSRGIDVIEPGEVLMTLKELRVRRSIEYLQTEDILEIGKMLNVDAVIKGSVEAFGISKGITVSYPEVSINLTLIDTVSGNVAWSAWHTAGGASFWTRHFGAEGSTLDATSSKVVKEAFDTLF